MPGCAICNTPRCSLCQLEKLGVGWEEERDLLYTWYQDEPLQNMAALLDLTTAKPGLTQRPDNDPTYDQAGLQEEQARSVYIPFYNAQG